MKRLLLGSAILALASTPAVANATSATAASTVSLTVQGNCSITNSGGAGNFSFPTITSGTSGTLAATAALAYSCSSGTTPSVAFSDASATGNAGFTLTAGSSTITYKLCLQANYSSGSCSSTINNSTTSTFAPPASATIPLEAFFTYSSSLAAGSYGDTVTATLTF